MVDATQNSFIPKRGPVKKVKQVVRRQVYIITVVAYVAFFSALLASGATFVYERIVRGQLADTITEFTNVTNSFNESELRRIASLESRLRQARHVLEQQLSFGRVLERVEQSTIVTSRISNLIMQQTDATSLVQRQVNPAVVQTVPNKAILVEAKVLTDSYDSVLFQRDTSSATQDVAAVVISDLTRNFQDATITSAVNELNEREITTYNAMLLLATDSFTSDPTMAAARTSQFSGFTQAVVSDTETTIVDESEEFDE